MAAPVPEDGTRVEARCLSASSFERSVLDELRAIQECGARLEKRLQEMSARPQVCATLSSSAGGGPGHLPSSSEEPEHVDGSRRLFFSEAARSTDDLGSTAAGQRMQFSVSNASEMLPLVSLSHDFVASSLPLGWPRVLPIRTEMRKRARIARTATRSYTPPSLQLAPHEDFAAPEGEGSRFGIDPNSRFHLSYSVLSLLMLIWDLTLLPYALAWDIPSTGFVHVSMWSTSVFWACDIGIHFLTAYYQDGELIRDARKIARHYIQSWFVPDAAVVICDWTSIAIGATLDASDTSRSLKMLRLAKLGRLLRIAGLMRMLRLVRVLEEVAEMHLSEGCRLVTRLLSLFMVILWATHLLACLWFAIGTGAPSDTGHRWTDFMGYETQLGGPDFQSLTRFYQYMVSFHWAAGQIALGSIDVAPTNSWERVVFVLAMLFGFLFGSTLVSMLSAAMMDYQMMRKDRTMKLRTLRQYMRENEVRPAIAVHMQRQVEKRLTERERLDEGDVAALQLLSVTLRSHLRFEIQRPCLVRHPLFRLLTSLDLKLMHRMCMKAMGFVNLRPKDDLFAPGASEGCAYTLVKGDMVYVQHPDSSPVTSAEEDQVHAGQWLCEAALWVLWTHVGKAEASSTCQLLSISAEAMSQCLADNMILQEIARDYGVQFHRRVTSARPPHAAWPTDLSVPFTDYCDLVVSMSKQVQITIGREALGHLATHRWARSKDNLADEVDAAKSIVVVTETGAIMRVVALVTLRVEDLEGRTLMQIGKWDGREVSPAVQLPGVKQETDELLADTLERMLETRLPFLRGKLDFVSTVREVEEKVSREYGVQTRYLRSIFAARCADAVEARASVCSWPRQSGRLSEASTGSAARRDPLDVQQRRIMHSVCSHEVFAVPVELAAGCASAPLFAWLPGDLVAALRTPAGERVLQHCLAGLSVPYLEPGLPPPALGASEGSLSDHRAI